MAHDSQAWENYRQGRELIQKADPDYNKAKEFLEKAVDLITEDEIFPRTDDPHFLLGIVYEHLNMFEKAVDQYKMAIKKDELNIAALTGLGNNYLWMGKFNSAVEVYNKALEIDKEDIAAHYGLAYAYSSIDSMCAQAAGELAIVMQKDQAYGYAGQLQNFIDDGCPKSDRWCSE